MKHFVIGILISIGLISCNPPEYKSESRIMVRWKNQSEHDLTLSMINGNLSFTLKKNEDFQYRIYKEYVPHFLYVGSDTEVVFDDKKTLQLIHPFVYSRAGFLEGDRDYYYEFEITNDDYEKAK